MSNVGYRDHRPGSRKGTVHEVFDTKGADAAMKAGRSRRLKESTVRVWMSQWKKKRPRVRKATRGH